jgi:hypothetical protein
MEERDLAYVKVLTKHLPEGNEEIYENLRTIRLPVISLSFPCR